MNRKNDETLAVFAFGGLFGIAAIGAAWHYGVRYLIPAPERLNMWTLTQQHWHHRNNFSAYLAWRWPPMIAVGYPYYFSFAVAFGIVVFGGIAALIYSKPFSFLQALIGCAGGMTVGLVAAKLVPLFSSAFLNPLLAALLMPGLGMVAGVITPVLLAPSRDTSVVRGTRIVRHKGDSKEAIKKASKVAQTAIAGVVLDRNVEVQHFAAVGVSGSGKSTALRDLMATALQRGDRHVVADPDGSSLKLFYRDGDVVLNPFDARSAKWDILAEIREETDYRFLSEAMLPFLGGGEGEEWTEYAREIFGACLKSWHQNQVGSSDQFFQAMATAGHEKLAALCEGTAAHRYFKSGNEKMLGSIMGTMVPRLERLRQLAGVKGKPFSIRHWMRNGRGSLWMPYQANHIAALRGLVSCWMGLAISEALTFEDSNTRRLWFHIDELDALGRIQGLKDAQTRVRKKGGCVVIGFQSIAQVRAVYGAAIADTIIENCGNKLILRCGASEGGGTAKFASDIIGEREVEYDEITRSHSNGQHASSSTSTHVQRRTEKAVLASEIMQLPDRHGYLKLASHRTWLKANFDYFEFPVRVKAYVQVESMFINNLLKGN